MANGCGFGSPANCGVGVHVIPSEAPRFGPMTIQNSNPMGHLRSIDFQRAPHVSITRIHGMAPTASLGDAPTGFTNGCHPSSTHYCRANAGPALRAPVSAPIINPPVITAPVYAAPAPVLRSWTGKGYDSSKFQARQYGDNTFTPGIAHIPTSIVDRSPINAQTILNSGQTVPQALARPSTATLPVAGHNIYSSNIAADGTYWEKTSGLTMFGDTVATQVICKRQLPRPAAVTPQIRVVNPIIPVPVAVPTPVPVSVPVCGPQAVPRNIQRFNRPQAHFGTAPNSRWVY